MKNWQIRYTLLIMLLAFALIPAGNAYAEESSPADEWEFHVTLYAWMADIGGQTASDSDIDIDFDDLFDDLEMAFMGTVGVHKGKWSFLTDVIYLDVEADDTIDGIYADLELKAWIVTPFASYSLVEGGLVDVDLLAGARYLYIKTDLRLGLTGLKSPVTYGTVSSACEAESTFRKNGTFPITWISGQVNRM